VLNFYFIFISHFQSSSSSSNQFVTTR